jgi:hypothetical protein
MTGESYSNNRNLPVLVKDLHLWQAENFISRALYDVALRNIGVKCRECYKNMKKAKALFRKVGANFDSRIINEANDTYNRAVEDCHTALDYAAVMGDTGFIRNCLRSGETPSKTNCESNGAKYPIAIEQLKASVGV